MDAGVGMDEDALGGEALGAVAGDGCPSSKPRARVESMSWEMLD